VLSGCCEISLRCWYTEAGWQVCLCWKARSLSLSVPKSFKICSRTSSKLRLFQQKNKYILKVSPMTQCVAWTWQATLRHSWRTAAFVKSLPIRGEALDYAEFIPGRILHSQYRARWSQECTAAVESSAFQVNYENVDKPEVCNGWIILSQNRDLLGRFPLTSSRLLTELFTRSSATPSLPLLLCLQPSRVADAISVESLWLNLQPLLIVSQPIGLYHEIWRLNEIRSLKLQSVGQKYFARKMQFLLLVTHCRFDDGTPLAIPLLLDNLRRLKVG